MGQTNQQAYTARRLVQHYAQLQQLQPAEQTILELLRDRWSSMKMLDIGVGGGRTTQHFAPLVREYTGIDYSTDMIAACQNRFAAFPQIPLLDVCDARDLSRFPDNTFDFILFSFNGIDYIPHGDRLKVFQEVSRVGKPGGYFCFSSHNLQGIERELNWRNHISLNPITSYVNLVMFALLRFFNPTLSSTQLSVAKHVIIRDESHNFRLKTYYIRPQEQLSQLATDFVNIKLYSWKSGLEILDEAELCATTEMWIYYLCNIK